MSKGLGVYQWATRKTSNLMRSILSNLATRVATASIFGCALLLNLISASGQILPEGVRLGPSMAGITEYTYPNGLRVLLLPDSGSSTITVNVTYLVGSRHEGNGETGMAHLLEHLNFIRTTNDRNIKKELEDRGARWNGNTWYDRTSYFETVTASTDNLRWALGLEADRMVNVRIEKEILDPEMTVVRNEFERGENNAAGVLEERVLSTAFLWHNYGKSTIGSRADIERVPVDRLAAFYRMYYQPDNAVLTIAGQLDPGQTLQIVAATLGAIPRPTRKLFETYTVEPPQDGERSIELRRVGKGKNLVLVYHAPAFAHPDSATLEVASGILVRTGIGRLDKALIDTKKAISISMDVYQLHDPGIVRIAATLNDEQSLDEVKKIILETIATFVREGPTTEEVDRAKTRIVQSMDRTFANTQQLALQLTEIIASGDWRLLFTNYEELKQVTAADITRAAKLYFKDANRTVGTFVPEAAPDRTIVPGAPTTESLLAIYTPVINVEAGEVLDPMPASIEQRILRSTFPGVTNGFRLALLPKATRNGRVQASLNIRFGDDRSLAGKNSIAQLTGGVLMRGTKTKSRQQIQDEIQKLNATINVNGSLAGASASISTTAENLIPALQLAMEILREPSFPVVDFEQLRTQRIAQADRGRTEPGVLVGQLLQANLSPYPRSDVRHVRTIDEEVEDLRKVTLDDLKAFHAQFYGASQGELVVVGKFEAAAVQRTAAELLTPWKSASPYARIINNAIPVDRINTKIETPDKENAQLSTGLRLKMRDTDPDYPAMVLANYMFGGSGLTARLPDRVRNREGLSYSVSSGFTAPVEGDAAAFSASAISNPGNTPKVESSFLDELTRTVRDGFAAAEVENAKKAIRDDRINGRSSDGAVLNLMETREQWGRTLAWDIAMDEKLAALTLDQVNAAFRRHVNPAAVSIVKGGDFKAAGAYLDGSR